MRIVCGIVLGAFVKLRLTLRRGLCLNGRWVLSLFNVNGFTWGRFDRKVIQDALLARLALRRYSAWSSGTVIQGQRRTVFDFCLRGAALFFESDKVSLMGELTRA